MAFLETKEFWASLIAALIGAAATTFAVWLAVILGLRKLRDTEMARLRIRCVTELIAYRFVLVSGYTPTADANAAFLATLNAIPGLFGNNAEAMKFLGNFREEEKDAALLRLMRKTAEIAGVSLEHVADIDLEKGLVVKLPTTNKSAPDAA